MNFIAVFIGGGIGAVLRYLTGLLFSNLTKSTLPISTFCVNFIGCFILGFLYFYIFEKFQIPSNIKLALTVGFCGGLTTFSTFSYELVNMMQNNQYLNMILYACISVLVGILAVLLGGTCAKLL